LIVGVKRGDLDLLGIVVRFCNGRAESGNSRAESCQL
jgi:hypothetical protein